ncbi:MAG TPA: YetF domain-containing protein [Acidobacteriaceae bacterium]|nr:YetF domain-containing protein [Acidobacteriaceae bacterium]
MALATVLRAIFGYLFLILMVRIAGRRPGNQLSPFEFILIFFLGGLTLTGIVGDEVSFTNAICQIITIACCNTALTWARGKWPTVGRLVDGTPLLLMEGGAWRANTMLRMRIDVADVMDVARDGGIRTLDELETAILERNGEISLFRKKKG